MVYEKSGDSESGVKRRNFLKAASAASAAALGGVASANPGGKPDKDSKEVLVGISAGAGKPREVAAEHTPEKAEVVHENKRLRYATVSFPDEAAEKALDNFIDAVEKKEGVKYAEKNGTYEALYWPNDWLFYDQYAPQKVDAPAAWDKTFGDSDVKVAIVDTGVQYDHYDLNDNFIHYEGYDFVDNDWDPYPDDLSSETHGTHVAGIAAAETNNYSGIAGMSNSTLMSMRVLNENGRGTYSNIADGIGRAAYYDADIINLSLGGPNGSSTLKNAIDYAYHEKDCLPVAAAGNDGPCTDCVGYPGAYYETLTVSATNSNDNFASYSSQGDPVDVAAPGSSVYSTVPTDSYGYKYGTSMASPVVAGAAALVLSHDEHLSASELRGRIKWTADYIGHSYKKTGAGRLNANDAVESSLYNSDVSAANETYGGQLSASSETECLTHDVELDEPRHVIVKLDGPSDADFDLYVNEASESCPTPSDYDYSGQRPGSQEGVYIENADTSGPLQIAVTAEYGAGRYDLTVTEKGKAVTEKEK